MFGDQSYAGTHPLRRARRTPRAFPRIAPSRVQRAWLRRFAASLCGAVLLALIAAAIETVWVRERAVSSVSGWAVLQAEAGLLSPAALLCGAAAGVLWIVLYPAPSRASQLPAKLSGGTREQRARAAAAVALVPLAIAGFLIVSAQWTLRLFAAQAPVDVVAVGAASSSLMAGVLITVLCFGIVEALARAGVRLPPPFVCGILGWSLALAAIGLAIAYGSTSAIGGSWKVFGVLRRRELDLRAPALVLGMLVCASVLPLALHWLRRRGRNSLRGSLVLVSIAVAPLALTFRSATTILNDAPTVHALRSGAPLGKLILDVARRWTDRDGDGFSAYFGHGDCDDDEPELHPEAKDIPGNGIDEDCLHGDEPLRVVTPPRPIPVAPRKLDLPEDFGVVLITVDTLRHDLGFMGNARAHTPNLDRLAERSVVFEKAYALASYTSNSLGPALIGKYASEIPRKWVHYDRFEHDTLIQERLQKAGVATFGVQSFLILALPGFGYERGFDKLDVSAIPKPGTDAERPNGHRVSDAALKHLAAIQKSRGRFYGWAHYFDPHAEYRKHREFDFGKGSRALYDGEVAFVDKHIGRVLNFIERGPLAERTAIIVTSDHGEAFNEHGMIRHGHELWEELVRVPLLIYLPGVKPARIQERRSLIDLVPTLLHLYGIELPDAEREALGGHSLVDDLFLEPGRAPQRRGVFIDMPAGPLNDDRQAYIEDDLKIIASDGRTIGLFDLSSDPGEKRNLLSDERLRTGAEQRYRAFRRELKSVPGARAPQ